MGVLDPAPVGAVGPILAVDVGVAHCLAPLQSDRLVPGIVDAKPSQALDLNAKEVVQHANLPVLDALAASDIRWWDSITAEAMIAQAMPARRRRVELPYWTLRVVLAAHAAGVHVGDVVDAEEPEALARPASLHIPEDR